MGNSVPTEESGAMNVAPEPENGTMRVQPEPENGTMSVQPEPENGTMNAQPEPENGDMNVAELEGGAAVGPDVSSPEGDGDYAAQVGSPGTPRSIPSLGPDRYNPSPVLSPMEPSPPAVIADDDGESWGTWRAPPPAADVPAEGAGGAVPLEDREPKRPKRGVPSGSQVQLSAVPVPGEAEESLLRQLFMREQERRIQEAVSLGIHLRAAEGEPLPMLSHYYGRPASPEDMYDSLSYALTNRAFLTRISLGGAGSSYVPGGPSGVTGPNRLERPEEMGEDTPFMAKLPSYPEPEQQPKLMVDASTITDNAFEQWSEWLRSTRQGRGLREWGLLASDLVLSIRYLSEAPPEVPAAATKGATKGGRWTNAGRHGRRKQQQQEYPDVVGMLAYLKEALRCVDNFDRAPTGYRSLIFGPAPLLFEKPSSSTATDEAYCWKYLAASMAVRVQRLVDAKRRKARAITEHTAIFLQRAKSAPRPRGYVAPVAAVAADRVETRSPTTPAEESGSSSDSSEDSGVSGESQLEGEGVAEAIGVIRACQQRGESLWSPAVICRLFETPELPHSIFPEAAKAMAEQAAAAPDATATDPTAAASTAAASTDAAAMVPPTPGIEPKSPQSLASVIFRPGRLIEKTLMIEASDGSQVPKPPAIPKRHVLPQPPPAPSSTPGPSSQSSPPNLGQTREEREFVLPKPQPVQQPAAMISPEGQFQDYESVVEAARAAIESANQQL